MTSSNQLGKLLRQMNIYNFDIIRKSGFNKSTNDNLIINLDSTGNGTHWVASVKSKKLYFDSYGQDMPKEIPKEYKYNKKIIEGINQNDCGELCCLWVYYINKYGNDKKFYNLFLNLYNP
jgi:hypothetical protein